MHKIPGVIARTLFVAAVIAGQGGNITAVDVHSGHSETAVDEIVVDFPDRTDLGDTDRDI